MTKSPEMKIHSDVAWEIASHWSYTLASDTRTLAAQIDVAIKNATSPEAMAEAGYAPDGAVTVKPVRFDKEGHTPGQQEYSAETPFGSYLIGTGATKRRKYYIDFEGNALSDDDGVMWFNYLKDAKEVVQTDYETRILSAITTQPVSEVAGEALPFDLTGTTDEEKMCHAYGFSGGWEAALREAAAKAPIPCYETRHVALGDKVRDAILALMDPQGAGE